MENGRPSSFEKSEYFMCPSNDYSNMKKVDNTSDIEDDMSNRVFTIDSIHNGLKRYINLNNTVYYNSIIREEDFALEDVPRLKDFLPNIPTYPNPLQNSPTYAIFKQHFVDHEDVVSHKIVTQKNNARGVHFWRAGPREKVYIIGGYDTQKGAYVTYKEVEKHGLQGSVAGIPKTIDNDIVVIDKSFGFDTAVEEAKWAINVAHVEVESFDNGVGIVRLME
ncbi:hypothetical protein GIB67_006467 [Kingdonia uniflora]|uniref:Phosphofructokinase domain-containing protein n=1 Tax=Kingdonia uniflora TaxID=39325 RepID=A0A7J7LEN9_9MAGN|nr:hypothetical protein GIB67_006467 [Kingdonia uniflora]